MHKCTCWKLLSVFVPIDNEKKNLLYFPWLHSSSWITTHLRWAALVLVRACSCAYECAWGSQYALRMFSQRSFLTRWFISSQTCSLKRYSRTQTHTSQTKERKTCSARKQVDDQTSLTEALWCLCRDLVLEICFTYSTLRELPLNSESEGWWIFQKLAGSCHTSFLFFLLKFGFLA